MGERENMVTMHDVLDAMWCLDNWKVGGLGRVGL
jgi:hypothetical protein